MDVREKAAVQAERNRIVRWLEAEQASVAQSIRDNVKDGPDSSVWWTLGAIAKSIRNGDHLKGNSDDR